MRIALLLVVLVACERGSTCEHRLKSRLDNDPRWRELFPATWVTEWMRTCREIDAGAPVSDEARKAIECIVDAASDDAAIRCATRIVGP